MFFHPVGEESEAVILRVASDAIEVFANGH